MRLNCKGKRIALCLPKWIQSQSGRLALFLACSLTAASVEALPRIELADSQTIAFGPQAYWAKRTKSGGTHQSGWLYGCEAGYQRLKPRCLYFAADGYVATGMLNGYSGLGNVLRSRLSDHQVEGRLGWSWQYDGRTCPTVTPFIGYGYFWETNKFVMPSVMQYHYADSFQYLAVGFLSSLFLGDRWEIGADFKAKMMIDGESRISHDPDPQYGTVTLKMENEWQYRVDLPVTYHLSTASERFYVSFVPFYEYRHYGGHQGYPFDFIDTKFNIYGIELMALYRF